MTKHEETKSTIDTPENSKKTSNFKRILLSVLIILPLSILAALFLAEKMVRYASPQITNQQAKSVSLKIYDESDTFPFTTQKNVNIVHIGHTHEFAYTIETNSLGYRMEEFAQLKPADEYRILTIGDSLTFGYGVEVDQSFPKRVETQLNKYLEENNIKGKKIKVINAAFVGGKSPDSYYLFLKEQGLKLNPDLVIVNYFVNNDVVDIDDNVWQQLDDFGMPTKISPRTYHIDPPYNRLRRPYQNWKHVLPILRDSHLWILFSTAWETKSPETVKAIKNVLGSKDIPLVSESENLDCLYKEACSEAMNGLQDKFYKSANATIELEKSNNIPIIVSILTANPQVEEWGKLVDAQNKTPMLKMGQIAKLTTSAQPQKNWNAYFADRGVPTIDVLPYLVGEGYQTLFYKTDGHPNAKGHEVISSAFFDFLTNNWNISEKVQQ